MAGDSASGRERLFVKAELAASEALGKVDILETSMHLASYPTKTNRTNISVQLPAKKCSDSAERIPTYSNKFVVLTCCPRTVPDGAIHISKVTLVSNPTFASLDRFIWYRC